MKKQKKFSYMHPRIVAVIAILLMVIVLVIWALEKRNVIDLYSPYQPPTANDEAKTTSTAPSAQEDFNDGDVRQPGSSLQENEGTGLINDQRGVASTKTNPNNWVTSTSGEITLHSPAKNDLVKTGIEVSGTSTLNNVSYRVIDNVSGVIAEGELIVVNGKFAGILNFNTSATEGRFDLFGTKYDGVEFSNIETPIRFE